MKSSADVEPLEVNPLVRAQPLQATARGWAGVSSFGYSGTIAHATIDTPVSLPPGSSARSGALHIRRRRFAWAKPAWQRSSAQVSAPSVPFLGSLRESSADEIVSLGCSLISLYGMVLIIFYIPMAELALRPFACQDGEAHN